MIRHALSVLLLLGATACGLADNERDEKNRRVYLNFYAEFNLQMQQNSD